MTQQPEGQQGQTYICCPACRDNHRRRTVLASRRADGAIVIEFAGRSYTLLPGALLSATCYKCGTEISIGEGDRASVATVKTFNTEAST